MSLSGKKILVGVTGSIAAYKAAIFVRALMKKGAEVKVVMTPSAAQFISPLTFSTLTNNECLVEYVSDNGNSWNNHVHTALWADYMVILPASMNTIAKMAQGICDNLLLAVYFSCRCKVYIAPAMDEDMWLHPSNQSNILKLKNNGNVIFDVSNGALASGLVGKGRLQEPEVIANQLESYILVSLIQKLKGKNILITAGPTYESIDPVRFIGNHSSGKMGIAIADLAHAAGAQVTLILGPCILPLVFDYNVVHIQSADEMYNHAKENFSSTDIAIFAAAVADYKPKTIENEKIKKQDCSLQIELLKNIDIAEAFGKSKKNNQISVGFALETNAEVEHAKQKIVKKNFDIIVLNSLKDKGAGFKHDTNKINIIDKYNNLYNFELKTKNEVAFDLLNYIDKKIL